MKHAKRLFTLLLAAVLCLGISVPAMAAVAWEDFRITSQPPEELNIAFGESFSLAVEVQVPAGAQVQYQWYSQLSGNRRMIEGATASTFQCKPEDPMYPSASRPYWPSNEAFYYCSITAAEKDADGNVIETKMLSCTTAVNVQPEREPTTRDNLTEFYNRWIGAPIAAAASLSALLGSFTFGIGFVLFPVLVIATLLMNLFSGGGFYYTPQ